MERLLVAPSGFILRAALCFLVSHRHDEALDGIDLFSSFRPLGCLFEFFSFEEGIEDLDDLFALRGGELLDLTEAPPEAAILPPAILL
jgi:hypothetical protein